MLCKNCYFILLHYFKIDDHTHHQNLVSTLLLLEQMGKWTVSVNKALETRTFQCQAVTAANSTIKNKTSSHTSGWQNKTFANTYRHESSEWTATPSLPRTTKKKMPSVDSFTHLRRLPTWAPCWVPPGTKPASDFSPPRVENVEKIANVKQVFRPTFEQSFCFVSRLQVVEHTVLSEGWLRRELKGVVYKSLRTLTSQSLLGASCCHPGPE